eukprot:6240077-Prymnesium_polylepis.1
MAPQFSVGVWNVERDGFFNLDERLAPFREAAGLTLPIARRPIWMPEFTSVNSTVVELVGFTERANRERFLHLFRGCDRDGDFLFADTGSNEGTWSLLAAAHGCRVVAVDPQP